MAPAPQVIPYMHPDGTEHAHIPDFYISSLNLIVNIVAGVECALATLEVHLMDFRNLVEIYYHL